ncbi:MAG: BNR-4 repeat-containing protein [Verrucomicrobiota bacterium]
MPHSFIRPALAVAFLMPLASQAGISGPYTADLHTTHLYHLHEAAGASSVANSGSAGGNVLAVGPNSPATATPAPSTALTGAAGFSAFGNAADLSGFNNHLLGYDANASGTYQADLNGSASLDSIELSTLGIGGNAPFTLEALIAPSSASGNRQIIATDSYAAPRGFLFRIIPDGPNQLLEFNLVGTSSRVTAPIPNSGAHAFTTGEWFHVAFTYDGTTARFYWTRLNAAVGAANPIGGNQALTITGGGSIKGPLVFGNENRDLSGEGLNGKIDEIRISSVARAASDFIFTPTAVVLTADDALGSSSFNQAGNWSNALAPSAAFSYATSYLLRTPENATNLTFQGTSLSLMSGGTLIHKGSAASQTYTISDLRLEGGTVRAGTNNTQTLILAGGITVSGSGSSILADQADVILNAPLSGTGALQLSSGTPANAHATTLNGPNTLTGDLTVTTQNTASSVLFSTSSSWKFAIGTNGVNNAILGSGKLQLGGAFQIDLSQASSNQGDRWVLVNTTTLAETFNPTFTVNGWINNNGLWIDPTGTWQFSQTSGELFVAPVGQTDSDGDNLPDAWEISNFGTLVYTGASDPDGDGDNNTTEYDNESSPVNSASNTADTDADSLPDAWEITHFGNLNLNAGDDPDGDRFGNLQELDASTSPVSTSSRPSGTAVKLVPVDDSNPATSEFGYAGASAINSVAFVRSSLQTFGDQQFMTWYGRHRISASAAFNNTLWIGRRTLGSSQWEIFKHPSFTANAITDGHDVISFGIDGDGFMHLSWGMHGDQFHYSKSTTPVTGTNTIALGPDTTMTGTENLVTYPQFLRLPDGDLLYFFREVASGNGDAFMNRYDIATSTWSNVHISANTQAPFIKGTGWNPNYNPYLNMPQLGGPDGDDLIITWCWRYEPVGGDSPAGEDGYQTNNNLNFARSPDAGLTWQRFNGTPYVLPINRDMENGNPASKAEVIRAIPEGSSLINQASTCLDANDNPVTCTWFAPGAKEIPANHRRQYMIVFRNDHGTASTADDSWDTRQVSQRTNNPTGTKYSESAVRDLGRPIVVTDDEDRIIVVYRDDAETNGITLVHSLPKADDPERQVWIQLNLTTDNLGNYEPIIDNELWDSKRQLHFLYQASEGEGYVAPANTASRISVLEWDALAYFAQPSQPSLQLVTGTSDAVITIPSEPSWSYRLWSTTDFTDWQIEDTQVGTGSPLVFTHTGGTNGPKRFWRIESAEGGFP